jgi:excisionase family DNA binding protein
MCRFLRTQQAAEYLDLSRRTLECWRTNGGGPVFRKIGGSVRYLPADLDQFIEAARRTSTAQPAEVVAR